MQNKKKLQEKRRETMSRMFSDIDISDILEFESRTFSGFQGGDQVRTFAVEETVVVNRHKRSRRSSATEDELNSLLRSADEVESAVFSPSTLLGNSVPGTPFGRNSSVPASPIVAYNGDVVGGGVGLPVSSASQQIQSTTTLITAANDVSSHSNSTSNSVSSSTTVIASGSILSGGVYGGVSINAFVVNVPLVDNEPCRKLLPTFHRVDKSPEEFESEVRKFPAVMMPARGEKKKQDMCDLLIKLYKTRYVSRNAADDSYYQTTQRFFYPKADLWHALVDQNTAKSFMDCTEHLTCVFCDAHFKLRNNTDLYVGVAGHQHDDESLRRPHQHTTLHMFLARILQEKLWTFMILPF